jgi:hypothetical protein
MPKSLVFVLVLLAGFTLAIDETNGSDGSTSTLAATQELPPALRDLNPNAVQMLSCHEAESVTGEWVLDLSLPLIATRIGGHGDFDLRLITLSGGVFAGNPVAIRIRIGR